MTTPMHLGATVLQQPRAAEGRVAGVCAGVARHWGVDPLVVRTMMVIAALSGAVGCVVYLVLWLWMPGPDGRRLVEQFLPGLAGLSEGWVKGLTVVLALTTNAMVGHLFPFGLGPVVVMGIAALIAHRIQAKQDLRRETGTEDARPASPQFQPAQVDQDSDFGRAVAAWQQRVVQVERAAPGAAQQFAPVVQPLPLPAPAPAPKAVERPRQRRRGSWAYGLITLGLAGVAFHVTRMALPSSTMIVPFSAALAVMSIALVVGAFTARPKLVIAVGIITSMLLAPASVVPNLGQSPTSRDVVWTQESQVTDQQVKGQALSLNLTKLQLTKPTRLVVTSEGGAVNVEVPANVPVTVEYDVRSAVLAIAPKDGSDAEAVSVLGSRRDVWSNDVTTGPRLTIVLKSSSSIVSVT